MSYTKIKNDKYIKININAENYTMSDKCFIDVVYDEIIDKIPETKYINDFNCKIKHGTSYTTKIPLGSFIYYITLRIGLWHCYEYKFCMLKLSQQQYHNHLDIKFVDGEKYPIVHINDVLPTSRKNLSCTLF
ncbi:hypothetical protein QLL95_gp0518 [Cotonvirus japonicus]|uniref:Uncharacterized protein n=1 Tax=Cotonvirus japonicus TaxID=2811091 RepID=A0ABM7NTV2_9VIRU|nr:hypothetical protein QLL95_gp0518 [Cotonvirus japonicus]BCS83605.1 hypothetical protein [Cotonvirus japonicus]